jgi:hypothetical protein
MKKGGKYKPSVYIIKGEKGIRVGQSICPKIRVTRVDRQLESCIVKYKTVHVIPLVDKKARLTFERTLIDIFEPKCNLIKR